MKQNIHDKIQESKRSHSWTFLKICATILGVCGSSVGYFGCWCSVKKCSTIHKLQVDVNFTRIGAPAALSNPLFGAGSRTQKFKILASSCTQCPPPMLNAAGTLWYHLKTQEPPRGEALNSAPLLTLSSQALDMMNGPLCVAQCEPPRVIISMCIHTRSVPARSRTKWHVCGPITFKTYVRIIVFWFLLLWVHT